MSKIIKRILSMMAVLALVLTMAPAGILAVETKAAAGDTNWTAAVANGGLIQAEVEAEQAKQTTAVNALKQLTGTTMEERRVQLKTILPTCPFCGKTVEDWMAVSTGTQYGGTGTVPQHFYAYGSVSKGFEAWDMSRDGSKACILLDEGAVISITGRIKMYQPNNIVNVGGLGTITSSLTASSDSNIVGLFHMAAANGTLNLYGGTYLSTREAIYNRPIVYMGTSTSKVNIWTDDVVIGHKTPVTTNRYNIRQNGGVLNMYGGTIQNGYSNVATHGWNVMSTSGTFNMYGGTITGGDGISGTPGGNVHMRGNFNMYGGTISEGKGTSGGNVYANSTAKVKIYGGSIIDGEATTGGNVYVIGGNATLEAACKVSGGKATGNGGNVHAEDGAKVTIKCDLIDGHAGFGGNLSVATATTEVILDGATLSGGTLENGTTLQNNARVPKGTLTLKNDANCTGGVLLWDDAESVLNVDSSFTGDFYLWQNGAAATPGTAVRNATCNGAFTGLIRNGNWLYAAATGDRAAVYIPVAMQWDGTTGLKYAAQGVVYNGVLTPAASGQAAVDAYVAAMANEEIEAKPQYVYVTEDVELKNGAEVAIWPGADITVSGNGVVAGVARKNDNYAEQGAAITVSGDVTVAKEVTVGSRRYIALTGGDNGNKYTFHRVEIELTNVTVNVDKAGIYYKAQYKFDEVVKGRVDSYGVLLNLNEAPTEESLATSSDKLDGYADATLVAASHGVYGIFKDGKESNLADGKTKVFGNPYLAINTTGEELEEYPMFTAAEAIGKSLADSMELANEKWDQLTPNGQTALNEFVNKWNALGAWETDLIAKLTNFTIA